MVFYIFYNTVNTRHMYPYCTLKTKSYYSRVQYSTGTTVYQYITVYKSQTASKTYKIKIKIREYTRIIQKLFSVCRDSGDDAHCGGCQRGVVAMRERHGFVTGTGTGTAFAEFSPEYSLSCCRVNRW